jgi:hypothetical protein
MPPYLTHIELWKSFWPVPGFVVVFTLIIAFLFGKFHSRSELFFVILGFSMLGIVTGYLSGFSRAPTLGTVLPAVLSLMGGLVVYMIGKDSSSRIIVSISMFAFALTLLIGVGWGSVMGYVDDEYRKSEIYLKNQAQIEAKVNTFRKKLDLPPLPVESKPQKQ